MEEKIFRCLVQHCVSPSSMSWLPLPSRYIVKTMGITFCECMKHLHSLKDKGLIEVVRGGYYDDWSGQNRLYCGWYVTDKAKETEIYKQEDEAVHNFMREKEKEWEKEIENER